LSSITSLTDLIRRVSQKELQTAIYTKQEQTFWNTDEYKNVEHANAVEVEQENAILESF
jgi:hypothetical protein